MTGLPAWVRRGASFRVAASGRLYHVRGVVDDRAVLRTWLKHKRRWAYVVEDETYFRVWEDEILVALHEKPAAV